MNDQFTIYFVSISAAIYATLYYITPKLKVERFKLLPVAIYFSILLFNKESIHEKTLLVIVLTSLLIIYAVVKTILNLTQKKGNLL